MRSPGLALLWEIWRVTRVEAAWKLALPTGAAMFILALSSSQREIAKDANAAIAMVLIVIPHMAGWLSMGRLNNGRPGFPIYLHYTRSVRTAVIVGLPMAYLTALSAAVYFVSALLLRVTSGYAFPLLSVAAWMAAITVVGIAGSWSTRNRSVEVSAKVNAIAFAWFISMQRLTAVEIPNNYDWPPRLWPTLFDWPRTDYAVIALIGLASFWITTAGVARQRRGDGWVEAPSAQRDGLWAWLINLFRLPCPTSSAARAQIWFDLRSNGLPLLTVGAALAMVILLVSAVSGPIDAAINADPSVPCPIKECFWARAWPPLLTPLSVLTVLLLAGNAFGIRRTQGRTSLSAFEATQAYGTVQLAALKLFVKSACVLAALAAIGVSAWISMPLLGDAVFVQMWGVPLNTQLSALNDAVAALTGYEQLAIAVVAVIGVVVWVATFALLGALWTRYSRRVNIAGSLLLLFGLALTTLAVAEANGSVSPFVVDAVLVAVRWTTATAIVVGTVYLYRSGLAERTLTPRYALGALLMSAAFVAAWVTLRRAAGLEFAHLPWTSVASMLLWPLFLPLFTSALAPWSLSRVRHL
jgi:hypothetical protein